MEYKSIDRREIMHAFLPARFSNYNGLASVSREDSFNLGLLYISRKQ